MKRQPRLGWNVFVFTTVGLIIGFVRCRPSPDFNALRIEIKDGSIAWSIVQVKVAGRDRDESGTEKDFDLIWAWVTLYERKDAENE